ncbi:hypothetical protein P3T35_005623 [Kitasatospora sp. GP30]|uniref:hypothetical protein n=1 Tax=Kitasatospora sp. GP30 TaxID=3035084 RepID=UPI0024747115|nr:hypothetical protein [Kitasatospora sp. GP30]MDH6143588.1 hypothetical protein [Kitasatospora sp. GP30]
MAGVGITAPASSTWRSSSEASGPQSGTLSGARVDGTGPWSAPLCASMASPRSAAITAITCGSWIIVAMWWMK